MLKSFQELPITFSTGALQIPLVMKEILGAPLNNDDAIQIETYVVTGTRTLTGSVSIVPKVTVARGMEFRFRYRADLITDTDSGKTFSIFGYDFTNAQARKPGEVKCWYNGAAWEVTYQDFGTEAIGTDDIADRSITEPKLADSVLSPRTFQDSSFPARAFSPASIPQSAFQPQSIAPNFIMQKSIGRSEIGDHQADNSIIGLMPPGSVKVGGDGWLPTDVQMNTPGPGSILIAQGYGFQPQPKLMGHQGTLTKDGFFYINPGAVLKENMGTYAISPEKADETMVSELIPFEVDFANASRNRKQMAFKGTAFALLASVEKDIVGDGTLTIKNHLDVVVAVIDVNNGDAKDVTTYATAMNPSAANFEKFDMWKFECAGSSAGILGISFLCYKR